MSDTEKKLQKLEATLSKMGSGLDAIDKTGDWTYFSEHKKQSKELIDSLPKKVREKLTSSNPNMHNWIQLREEVRKLKK